MPAGQSVRKSCAPSPERAHELRGIDPAGAVPNVQRYSDDVLQLIRKPITVVLMLAALALPAILIVTSTLTFRAMDEQRAVYLRSRVASIAARLETLPAGEAVENMVEEEEGLAGIAVLEPPRGAAADPLAPLWDGRELFRTKTTTLQGEPVLRAYIPFHASVGLRIARIDVAERSADFLVEHARHNLWISSVSALAIIALTLTTAWSARRAARAEHLAHIGEMSAALAHEIRNPLGTIKGFAQLLGEKLKGGHEELLAPILAETSRLEALVKDLLLYGRPAAPTIEALEARTVVETIRAHAGVLDAAFEAQAQAVTFRSDPNLLEQALLNLIRNAVEAVRERPEGYVRLQAEAAGTGVLFRVSDNGPGLGEEARRRLFEPFYTTKAFGTGLGLAITRKLVEALGGTLRIGNQPQGGAVAEIRLPG